jgi:hypothetical protein
MISKLQYLKALETVKRYEAQQALLSLNAFTPDDLAYYSYSIEVEKVKDGIGDEWLTRLQTALTSVGVSWFSVGTDDVGHLSIELRAMDTHAAGEKVLQALNQMKK